MRTSFLDLAVDTWLLGLESSAVIAARLSRLALGDTAALAEAQLMVSEKIESLSKLHWMAMTGGLGIDPRTAAARSIRHYRKAVGKNRRRLAQPRS